MPRASAARWRFTPSGSIKIAAMATLLSALVLATGEKSTSEEGRDIILVMLGVGLIFLSVIALGQLGRWYSHKREAARRTARRPY